QVQWPLEGFEEHLQRVRRNVQLQRQLGNGLAIHQRQWQLLLQARLCCRQWCAGSRGLAVHLFTHAAESWKGLGSPQPTRSTSGSPSARLTTVEASRPP